METLYRLSYWGLLDFPSGDRLHGGNAAGEIGPEPSTTQAYND